MSTYPVSQVPVTTPTAASASSHTQLLAAPAVRVVQYQVIVPWEVVRFVYQSGYRAFWMCLQERFLLFPLATAVEVEAQIALQTCDTINHHDHSQVNSRFVADIMNCQTAFKITGEYSESLYA